MSAPDVGERLSNADWNELGRRLVNYASRKLTRAVVGGQSTTSEMRRQLAEDFASAAMVDVISRTRKWDPEKDPLLLRYLMDVVDSKISHHLTSMGNQLERQASDSFDYAVTPRPDGNLIYEDIRLKLGEEPELVELLDAIVAGHETCGELAAELGLTTDEVVNRRKRLRRRVQDMGYAQLSEVNR